MKRLVFLLFVSKALFLTKAIKWPDEYDVTNALNDTIVGLFRIAEPQNIVKLLDSLVHFDRPGRDFYDTDTPYKYDFGDGHLLFFYIHLTHATSNCLRSSFDFLNNAMELYSSEFIVHLSGSMGASVYRSVDFTSSTRFSGYKITTIRQSNNSKHSFFINSQHEHADVKLKPPFTDFPLKDRKRILPLILRTHMNRNDKFKHALAQIYDEQTKHIIYKHPHFMAYKHLHHYRIPNILIGSLQFKDIAVRGLWNFHSLNSTEKYIFTYRLLIKNIRGSMILEDISDTLASTWVLNLFVDSLSIFITREMNQISVKAENYSIIEAITNTRITKVEASIIDRFEQAIGFSLMPSMKYQRKNKQCTFLSTGKLKTIIRKYLIENPLRSNEPPFTQQPFEESTKFTHTTNAKNQVWRSEEKTKNIIYNYNISFHDININLL